MDHAVLIAMDERKKERKGSGREEAAITLYITRLSSLQWTRRNKRREDRVWPFNFHTIVNSLTGRVTSDFQPVNHSSAVRYAQIESLHHKYLFSKKKFR